jgi:hypothetical protein
MKQFNVEMKEDFVFLLCLHSNFKRNVVSYDFSFKPQQCSYLPRSRLVYLLKSEEKKKNK